SRHARGLATKKYGYAPRGRLGATYARGSPIAAALSAPRRPWRLDLARSSAADGTHASAPRSTRPSRPSHLRRFALRLRTHLRHRHRLPPPLAHLPAPGALRADHVDGGAAERMAHALRQGAHGGKTMSDAVLTQLRDLIQDDIGKRGLRTDPERNLVNAFPDDFHAACRSLADHPVPVLAVVTGFFIPPATPPAGETDGPLGALFLARALVPLGIRVVLVSDDFCERALHVGLGECGLRKQVPVIALPTPA